MIKITLYTERKNTSRLIKLVSRFFQGFTVQNSIGFWHGTREKSLAFVILTDKKSDIKLSKKLAKEIKILNKQEAVLQTVEKTATEFI